MLYILLFSVPSQQKASITRNDIEAFQYIDNVIDMAAVHLKTGCIT
jgi:hypothetical protein